jgi:DNA-binding transcriptional LysR family regulator
MHDMTTDHVMPSDLNLLASLDLLLETRSVTAAAARAGVTQSAMSRTLARLRDAFRDPLFVRTRRGMEPTAAAAALAVPVRAAIEQARAVFAGPPAFDPRTAERAFTIAASDFSALVLLPALVRRMRTTAPGVTVRAVPLAPIPTDALDTGTADLVVGFSGAPRSNVRWQLLFEDTLACVARKQHPALDRTLTLARYLACRHLSITPAGTGDGVDRALGRRGRRTIAVHATHFLVAPALLRDDDLILTTGARVANALAKLAPLAVVEAPIEIGPLRIGQLWHERNDRDPAHAWLRALVKDVAA